MTNCTYASGNVARNRKSNLEKSQLDQRNNNSEPADRILPKILQGYFENTSL